MPDARLGEQQVDALETWRSWATGNALPGARLRDVVAVLDSERGPHGHRYRQLGDRLGEALTSHGLELNRPPEPTHHRIGLEIGMGVLAGVAEKSRITQRGGIRLAMGL